MHVFVGMYYADGFTIRNIHLGCPGKTDQYELYSAGGKTTYRICVSRLKCFHTYYSVSVGALFSQYVAQSIRFCSAI